MVAETARLPATLKAWMMVAALPKISLMKAAILSFLSPDRLAWDRPQRPKDRGFAVIGVDADLTQTNPDAKEVYLTSVLKKIDVAVYDAVTRMDNGTFEGGTNLISTLENGGVGLAPFYDWDDRVPQELKDELAAIEQGIIDGSISTGLGGGEEMAAAEAPAAGELGSAENPIQVLFVPSAEAGVIVSGGEVMAQALNEATGLNFEVEVPTSYAATIEAMCASTRRYDRFYSGFGLRSGQQSLRRGSWGNRPAS